jgi:hypothetical protein
MEALWSKITTFSDEQRCERLQTCQDLSKCVQNCLTRQQDMLASKEVSVETVDMENCVAGIRMMKYFGWRESQPLRVLGENEHQVVSTKQEQQEQDSNVPPTCAREVHAQWGCRAVALACSPDLIKLKNCFNAIGKDEVLSVPYFGYAPGDESKSIPCREIQESLGKCVAERAAELELRVTASRSKEAAAQEAGN